MKMTREEAISYLTSEFNGISCYNCKFHKVAPDVAEERFGYYGCDDCHPHKMGWAVNREHITLIVNELFGEP